MFVEILNYSRLCEVHVVQGDELLAGIVRCESGGTVRPHERWLLLTQNCLTERWKSFDLTVRPWRFKSDLAITASFKWSWRGHGFLLQSVPTPRTSETQVPWASLGYRSSMKYAFHELRCEVLQSFWSPFLQVFEQLYNDFLQKTQAVVIFGIFSGPQTRTCLDEGWEVGVKRAEGQGVRRAGQIPWEQHSGFLLLLIYLTLLTPCSLERNACQELRNVDRHGYKMVEVVHVRNLCRGAGFWQAVWGRSRQKAQKRG